MSCFRVTRLLPSWLVWRLVRREVTKRVRPESIMRMRALVPLDEIVHYYTGVVSAMMDVVASNMTTNSTLAALRDALLPKLISGELYASPTPKRFIVDALG